MFAHRSARQLLDEAGGRGGLMEDAAASEMRAHFTADADGVCTLYAYIYIKY